MKRFVYLIREEELWNLLSERAVPIEVIGREGNLLKFATYEPLEGLNPVSVEEVREDWKDWRASFGPVEVGDIVVVPPWKRVLRIKPGIAFGTGLHPTTRLCLLALQDFVREGDTVLDVGTGSGILAIASKILGAGRVVAVDISEEAVRECRENASFNGVEVECLVGRAKDVVETFDLVVANLDIEVFREEIGDIVSRSKGKMVFSGLYGREELEEFLSLLGRYGYRAGRIFESENWFCVRVGDAGD